MKIKVQIALLVDVPENTNGQNLALSAEGDSVSLAVNNREKLPISDFDLTSIQKEFNHYLSCEIKSGHYSDCTTNKQLGYCSCSAKIEEAYKKEIPKVRRALLDQTCGPVTRFGILGSAIDLAREGKHQAVGSHDPIINVAYDILFGEGAEDVEILPGNEYDLTDTVP